MATRKRSKRKKPSATKRISASLARWLKKQNPAMRHASAVHVQRLKGGAIKLNPVRRVATVKRGGANYWIVKRKV